MGIYKLLFIMYPIVFFSVLCSFTLFAQSPINITFGADEVGKFPSGWVSRNGNNAKEIYSVQVEGEKKFLHADAKGASIQIGYEKKWGLKEFPILRWQWRAIIFPSGSNEREKRGGDSVLGLYIVFGHWPSIRTIKYIWSDTLPVGASFNSPFSNSTKILVVRSGRALMGRWVTEQRDVLSDYQQLMEDRENTPVATGIAVLTDSDNTNSRAIGDYAYIQVSGIRGGKPSPP